MAEAEDKTQVGAEGSEEQAAEKKPGGSKKFLLFGIIGVCAIVVGVVLALFIVRPMMSKSGDTSPTETTHEKAKSADEHGSSKSDEHGGSSSGNSVYTVKDIVVNPANTGGTRFLSVSFAFDLKSAAVVGDFEAKELAIRDALITILSAKTVAQLTDPKEKEIVRYQIRKRISDILKTDQLAQVYYTDFVLQ